MADGVIKPVVEAELEEAHKLEETGYPADEGASLESLTFRQNKAPNLFQGYYLDGNLIGYICGTRYDGDHMVEESMSEHKEHAENVCIHSVCVSTSHRRQGIASALLKYYIQQVVPQEKGVKNILLMCKNHMIPLYTKAGFLLVGKSCIVHGADPWYEMKLTMNS